MTPYDIITERIISMLEKGTAPWTKTWSVKRGMPRNLVSGKPYRGINVWLLHSAAYESPFWLTYKQATEAGGNIKKGEKSMPAVFWKLAEVADEKTGEAVKVPLLRYYSVFNLAQVQGLKEPEASATTSTPAALIVSNMPKLPQVKTGMASAFYDPNADTVGMPDFARFDSEADYYGTLFHELAHATGHTSRLNRLTPASFGSETYSKEELVAEMASAFLCAQAGLERHLENSASYIAGWLKALKDDRKLIVNAAACAQKASDYILDIKHEKSE